MSPPVASITNALLEPQQFYRISKRLDFLLVLVLDFSGEFGNQDEKENEDEPQPCGGRNGFGRAVSRILSAPLAKRRESFVSAAGTRDPFHFRGTWSGPLRGPLFGLAPDGVFRAPPITLRAVVSYTTFSPLRKKWSVGALECGRVGISDFPIAPSLQHPTSPAVYFLWHCPSGRLAASPPACIPNDTSLGYAASRPMVFGLSSPGSRRKRFSALPKSP